MINTKQLRRKRRSKVNEIIQDTVAFALMFVLISAIIWVAVEASDKEAEFTNQVNRHYRGEIK